MPRFKVLIGQHSEGKDPVTNQPKIYKPGDIVDSKSDLTRFNTPHFMRFELLAEQQPAVAPVVAVKPVSQVTPKPPSGQVARNPAKDLDSFTEAELRSLAEDSEIDLKGAKTKADMVKIIAAANAGK